MDFEKELNRKVRSLCIILDPAHGQDVAGKRSPDGKHLEYKWSRETISAILSEVSSVKSENWTVLSPYLDEINEPGIRNRVDRYNAIAAGYDLTVVLSLHNDALNDPPKWWKGKGGFTLFTSRGETEADPICTFIGEMMNEILENEVFRFDFGLSRLEEKRDLDREVNYTVITGYNIGRKNEVKAKYAGILIENLFMDIKPDFAKLQSPEWNKKLRWAYVVTLLLLATKLGFDNCINPITIKEKKNGKK